MTKFVKKLFFFTLIALILASALQIAPSVQAAPISAGIRTTPDPLKKSSTSFDLIISGLTQGHKYTIIYGDGARPQQQYDDGDIKSLKINNDSFLAGARRGGEFCFDRKPDDDNHGCETFWYFVPNNPTMAAIAIANICNEWTSFPQSRVCEDPFGPGTVPLMIIDLDSYGSDLKMPTTPAQLEVLPYASTVLTFVSSVGEITVEVWQHQPGTIEDNAELSTTIRNVEENSNWDINISRNRGVGSFYSTTSTANNDQGHYWKSNINSIEKDPLQESQTTNPDDEDNYFQKGKTYYLSVKNTDSEGIVVQDMPFTIKSGAFQGSQLIGSGSGSEENPVLPSDKVNVPCTGTDCDTAIGKISTNPTDFITNIFTIALGIAGGVAFLLMVFGAFRLLTSQGNPDSLNAGRDLITSAVVGLLFITFSVLLLRIIGVDILEIPGFGIVGSY